jgi:Secretion system C-terminal sorting domain
LKQLDFDGKTTYSKVVSIKNLTDSEVSIFPNPTDGLVAILGFENMPKDIQIVNDMGIVLKTLKTTNNTLDMSELPDGVYAVLIKIGTQTFVTKVFKFK